MLEKIVALHSAEIGLLMFFVSFVVIALWTATRTRKEVNDWSSLPLSSVKEPAQSQGVDRDD